MSYYKEQEYDFVNRTKKLISQYENFQIDEKERFEVTLLINCFVGLLITPQQHWIDEIPETLIRNKEWGLKKEYFRICKDTNGNELLDIKQVTRHLRNSVAHYRFQVFSNQNDIIKSIKFTDKNNNGITFEAEIPISKLKEFLITLSNWFLIEMKRQA